MSTLAPIERPRAPKNGKKCFNSTSRNFWRIVPKFPGYVFCIYTDENLVNERPSAYWVPSSAQKREKVFILYKSQFLTDYFKNFSLNLQFAIFDELFRKFQDIFYVSIRKLSSEMSAYWAPSSAHKQVKVFKLYKSQFLMDYFKNFSICLF